jgi:hypothetical protein
LFNPGDCFRVVSGKYEDGRPKRHLFVVVTDFDEETGDAIMVSFSSTADQPRYDKTTVIPAGSHKYITEESYAAYYLAGRKSEPRLREDIDKKIAVQVEPISGKILARLRAGIMASKDTPPPIKDFYEDCLFRRLKKPGD